MISKRTFLAGLVLVCAATFALSDGLHQEPEKDETHFLHSSYVFRGAFGLEALRNYPELVTPLALVIWGELDHVATARVYVRRRCPRTGPRRRSRMRRPLGRDFCFNCS